MKVDTCVVDDVSLLAQKLDGRLALAESLRTSMSRLSTIPSPEEALRDLGTFAFVASHIFSAGGQHSSAVAELLCLIKRLKELHTKVQGIISSPHLSTTLLYNVSRRWILYLKRCVAVLASDPCKPWVPMSPFSLSPSWSIWRGGGDTLAPSAPFFLQTWCTVAEGVVEAERKTRGNVVAATEAVAAAAAP